ncbi:MAG: transporter substrate-binding domain-containing protein [Gammaproteobacteria bacterium]|nr:MAG: transporter substrate-binding domain-containing protein [Gammaproteobacteria bacterium]
MVLCFLFIMGSCLPHQLHADQAAPTVVRYPSSDSNPYYYKRVKYFVEMLQLALLKSDHNYQLEKLQMPFMNETRSKTNIAASLYDVHWLNAQTPFEAELEPVRIPLCKGLSGWRILFIRPESQAAFSKIKNMNDLRQYLAGHGSDWPDAARYESLNLPQKLSGSWKGLFSMLKQNRIDYLSRSALEIYDEDDAFPELNLKVESQLVIRYPAAYYFYVRKNNPQLAADVKIGLERAIADGSFDEIFNRYFSEKINRLHMESRRIIEIPLPEDVPLIADRKSHPSYWYTEKVKLPKSSVQ